MGHEAGMRILYFAVNIGTALLAAAGCILCLVVACYEGGSPATLGGRFQLGLGSAKKHRLGRPPEADRSPGSHAAIWAVALLRRLHVR